MGTLVDTPIVDYRLLVTDYVSNQLQLQLQLCQYYNTVHRAYIYVQKYWHTDRQRQAGRRQARQADMTTDTTGRHKTQCRHNRQGRQKKAGQARQRRAGTIGRAFWHVHFARFNGYWHQLNMALSAGPWPGKYSPAICKFSNLYFKKNCHMKFSFFLSR